eukprot:SAG11_NODE_5000_length_1696_cov_1.479649_2_plen_74_part_00
MKYTALHLISFLSASKAHFSFSEQGSLLSFLSVSKAHASSGSHMCLEGIYFVLLSSSVGVQPSSLWTFAGLEI